MTHTIHYIYITEDHRKVTEAALRDHATLGALAHAHPTTPDIAYIDLFGTQYTRRSIAGKVMEQWTKQCGEWVDTTARAQLAEDKEAKQRQLIAVAQALRKAQQEEQD